MQESERLLIAANKAKESLPEWYCAASAWASTNTDSIKYYLHTGPSEFITFDTLEALEAWVDRLSLGGNREIIHRSLSFRVCWMMHVANLATGLKQK